MITANKPYGMALLEEAKRWLVQELTKQPQLSIIFTTEERCLFYIGELINEGYLDRKEVKGLPVFSILPKAKDLYNEATQRQETIHP